MVFSLAVWLTIIAEVLTMVLVGALAGVAYKMIVAKKGSSVKSMLHLKSWRYLNIFVSNGDFKTSCDITREPWTDFFTRDDD